MGKDINMAQEQIVAAALLLTERKCWTTKEDRLEGWRQNLSRHCRFAWLILNTTVREMMSWNYWQLKATSPRIMFDATEKSGPRMNTQGAQRESVCEFVCVWATVYTCMCLCVYVWSTHLSVHYPFTHPVIHISSFFHHCFLCAGHWGTYWRYKS